MREHAKEQADANEIWSGRDTKNGGTVEQERSVGQELPQQEEPSVAESRELTKARNSDPTATRTAGTA